MSPVPAYDLRGLLPPYLGPDATTHARSPYFATMSELLLRFGTSPARCNLIHGFLGYRGGISRLGYAGHQFIDGSFVEDVETREGRDPGDIDVFSFLIRPSRYQTDPAVWASTGFPEWQAEIADRTRNRTSFGLDTYAIAIDAMAGFNVITQAIYWYSLFSHRRVTHDWKGFVAVPLNPTDDALAKSALLTGP